MTADEQVMISTLSALYVLQQEACAALEVSQRFTTEANRVLARVQVNHPTSTATLQAQGAGVMVRFAPKAP